MPPDFNPLLMNRRKFLGNSSMALAAMASSSVKAASLTDLLQKLHLRLRNADLPPSAGSSF